MVDVDSDVPVREPRLLRHIGGPAQPYPLSLPKNSSDGGKAIRWKGTTPVVPIHGMRAVASATGV